MDQKTDNKNIFGRMVGGIFLLGIVCWILYWAGVTLFASHYKETRSNELDSTSHAQQLVVAACFSSFDTYEIRLEPRYGKNLRIYLKKVDFEHVPYPDRESVVEHIGSIWCSNVSHTYLPSVSFHDIKTGDELANYSCTLKSVSLK